MKNNYIKYIKLSLLLFSLGFLVIFIFPRETFKYFGNISWLILVLVMMIRPLRDLFSKNRFFDLVIKLRRELGILVGVFGIAHVIGAFAELSYWENLNSYIDIIKHPLIWNYKLNYFWGMLGFVVSIPLLITSNTISASILKANWKILHRLSYLMFVFVGLHIFMIKGEVSPIYILGFWFFIFILAHLKNRKLAKNPSDGPKWLCIVCGYIYDENVGDVDSGILPGTRFEDIPDDWKCPLCGVGKGDFILVSGMEEYESIVDSIEYLTKNVIELKLDFKKDISYKSGQSVNFALNDKEGRFFRNYSIANKNGNIFTFFIKLKEDGRAGVTFKNMKKGQKIIYSRISGEFTLKNTLNQKIFIASGTGLAPVYSMLSKTIEKIPKKLYFQVARSSDLFYLDELRKIRNLEINIFLSKEEIIGYNFGRVNFKDMDFDKNSEFYICGNPGIVKDISDHLMSRGFEKVYFELFT